MDVIINNPPSQTYAPIQGAPYGYGYGPGYPGYYGPHHGGPGFLLPLLLIGGLVFFLKRRRWAGRRWAMTGGRMERGQMDGGRMDGRMDAEQMGREMRDAMRRKRDRFFGDGALDIARERYAKGEINADEYEILRRTLSGEPDVQRGEGYQKDGGDLKL